MLFLLFFDKFIETWPGHEYEIVLSTQCILKITWSIDDGGNERVSEREKNKCLLHMSISIGFFIYVLW